MRNNAQFPRRKAGQPVFNCLVLPYHADDKGLYVLRNVLIKDAIGIGSHTSESTGAVFRDFVTMNSDVQLRIEDSIYSGYHYITKTVDGKKYYLRCNGNTLTFEQGTSMDSIYYTFRFIKKENGNYLIVPKVSERENKVISVVMMQGGGYLCVDTNNASFAGNEWNLILLQTAGTTDQQIATYPVTVEVKYNHAYETVKDNADLHIYNQMIDAQNYFLGQFGILLNIDFDFTKITSIADTNCPGKNETGTAWDLEDCVDCEGNDHGNSNNLAESITKTSQIAVLFTGHDLCWDGNGGHHKNIAGVCSRESNIIDAEIVVGYQSNRLYERGNLIHELGHAFDANDHYGSVGQNNTEYYNIKSQMDSDDYKYYYGEEVYNSDCIYGENHYSNTVVNSLSICNGCRTTIQNKLEELF